MSGAELPLWAAVPAAVLLVAGGLLTLVGSLGLLRLDVFYARIHAPTMGTTLGTGCVLLASMLYFSVSASRWAVHELLISLFVLLTAPVVSMLLMRAGVSRDPELHPKAAPENTIKSDASPMDTSGSSS